MKNFLLILLLAFLAASSSRAALITQTQTGDITPGEGATFSYNQFNPSLGTLSAIDLIIQSSIAGGTFNLSRANTGGSTLGYLTGFTESVFVSDNHDDIFSGPTKSISFSGNTTIPRNMGIRTFTVDGSQSLLNTSPTTVSIGAGSWYLYTGPGTVDIDAALTPEATFTSGLGITADYLNLLAPSTLTLRYTYTPVGPSPVPEPGQVAASILALGGICIYFVLRRRRSARVSG